MLRELQMMNKSLMMLQPTTFIYMREWKEPEKHSIKFNSDKYIIKSKWCSFFEKNITSTGSEA